MLTNVLVGTPMMIVTTGVAPLGYGDIVLSERSRRRALLSAANQAAGEGIAEPDEGPEPRVDERCLAGAAGDSSVVTATPTLRLSQRKRPEIG